MIIKLILPLPLFLTSCTTSSDDNKPSSDSERDVMARKLITFQQSYDRFDDNGDGSLSRSEVSAGLADAQYNEMTSNTIPLIFAFYDTNRDGLISLDEINAGYDHGPEAALRLKAAHAAQE